MDIQKQIKTILATEMDRKDFLKNVAIGVVGLVGGGVLLRLSSLENRPRASHAPRLTYGGDSVYGGTKHPGGDSRPRRVT